LQADELEHVGYGAISNVYEVAESHKNSVVKVFKSSISQDAIDQEIEILLMLKSGKAPHTVEIITNGSRWITLAPLCNVSCLANPALFQNHHWIQGIMALRWLHDKGYVHRDIRPENIMLPYEKKSSNFYTIFIQFHIEIMQFLQFLEQKSPYNFRKLPKNV